jgi:hypothetical protein
MNSCPLRNAPSVEATVEEMGRRSGWRRRGWRWRGRWLLVVDSRLSRITRQDFAGCVARLDLEDVPTVRKALGIDGANGITVGTPRSEVLLRPLLLSVNEEADVVRSLA